MRLAVYEYNILDIIIYQIYLTYPPSSTGSVCENGTLVCTKLPCPVYEPWSPWSTCSASCGHGQRTRTRLCQDTEDGPSCANTMQTESCDLPACPGLLKSPKMVLYLKTFWHLTYWKFSVNSLIFASLSAGCLLSEWSPWSDCSATCGGGLSVRNKTVLQEPEPGGMACVGPLEQHTVCNTNSCLPGNTKAYIILHISVLIFLPSHIIPKF